MKRRFASFFSGFLACALIVGGAVSALAISGRMTIEVDPISIQVNGVTFQPTDVNGKDVPVFAYNGTTYAPLRALAEAYGLTVGYDAESNMATVTDPEAKPAENPAANPTEDPAEVDDYSDWSPEKEAAYQEFKAMWTATPMPPYDDHTAYYKLWTNDTTIQDMVAFIRDENLEFAQRLISELDWDMSMALGMVHFENGESLYILWKVLK